MPFKNRPLLMTSCASLSLVTPASIGTASLPSVSFFWALLYDYAPTFALARSFRLSCLHVQGACIEPSLDRGVGVSKAVFRMAAALTMPIRPHHRVQYWSRHHTAKKPNLVLQGCNETHIKMQQPKPESGAALSNPSTTCLILWIRRRVYLTSYP